MLSFGELTNISHHMAFSFFFSFLCDISKQTSQNSLVPETWLHGQQSRSSAEITGSNRLHLAALQALAADGGEGDCGTHSACSSLS